MRKGFSYEFTQVHIVSFAGRSSDAVDGLWQGNTDSVRSYAYSYAGSCYFDSNPDTAYTHCDS
jgi:hypothetical protein